MKESEGMRGLPIEEVDRISRQVQEQIHQGADSGYCVIHVDPAELSDAKESKT